MERSRSSASPVLSGLENVTLVMPLTRTAEISFTLLTPLTDVSGQTPVDTPPLAEHWAWKKDKAKRGKSLDNRKVGSYVFVRVLESGTKERECKGHKVRQLRHWRGPDMCLAAGVPEV